MSEGTRQSLGWRRSLKIIEPKFGKDEAGKPYQYDCLAKDFKNMETVRLQ